MLLLNNSRWLFELSEEIEELEEEGADEEEQGRQRATRPNNECARDGAGGQSPNNKRPVRGRADGTRPPWAG